MSPKSMDHGTVEKSLSDLARCLIEVQHGLFSISSPRAEASLAPEC